MKNILLATISFQAYDWLPYPVGCLISHCKKDDFVNKNYNFFDPEYRSDALDHDDFHTNLKQTDILGLTNYIWNQGYNDKISKLFKTYNPKGVVIYGGPQIPEDKENSKEYIKDRPYVDLFFVGPGEESFLSYLKDPSRTHEINGIITAEKLDVKVDRSLYKKIQMPTPYIDGVFDNILKRTDRIAASFETNRGCPYACAFCDWGGTARNKINFFDDENIQKTIEYIFSHDNIHNLEIVDANFGIVERDKLYIEKMIGLKEQREKDINLTFSGFAKNGGKYVQDIIELTCNHFGQFHGRQFLRFSFQSHDETVLKTINRDNIKNEKLIPMIEYFKEKDIEIDAEMIMGLPGDNVDRWLASIQKNVDLSVNHQKTYPLFVLPNTPIFDSSYRKKHSIKLKKLLIPYDLDDYTSKDYHKFRQENKIVRTTCDFKNPDEYKVIYLVYECDSFDSKELVEIYSIWFWFNTLYNAKVARHLILNDTRSVKEQYECFVENLNANRMPLFKKLFDEHRSNTWNTIAKPEPITKVTDLNTAIWFGKFIARGNELVDIVSNKDTALKELQTVYPDATFDHFVEFPDKDLNKLYLITAEVT